MHFTQPVAFSAASQQPLQIDVTPGADYSHVDLRLDNQLSFRAVFSCAQEAQGHDYTVDLQASVDTLAFAHARPQVFCDGVPAAVVPPPHKKAAPAPPHRPALAKAVAAAAQPQTVIALAPIPPPPPARAPVQQSAQAQAPAQAPQPGQATSQVVQSQGQTSPVQMAADQRQESPVVQRVHLDGDAAPGEGDLHFARADSIDGVDHDAWWAAMLVRTLGFGAVLGLGAAAVRRRERAPQAKRARNRR